MTTNTYRLPVWDTITAAWNRVCGSKGTIWAAMGMLFLIAFGFGLVGGIFQLISPILKNVVMGISQLFTFLLTMGLMYIGIQRAQDKPITYTQVFYTFNLQMAGYLIAAYILMALCILPLVAIIILSTMYLNGGIALIIDIICYIAILFIWIRICLTPFFILDLNLNPVDAVKRSYAFTQCNVWRILGIMFLACLILSISAIPLGIGLIWTIPFMYICYGLVYQNLKMNYKG